MKKNILGLDLGTNSIGWAYVNLDSENVKGSIEAVGSRIIPMTQDVLGKFDSGVTVSQTAERTNYRSIRKIKERQLLRRQRLHRVLNLLGFLPLHYAEKIDWEKNKGQFFKNEEVQIPYFLDSNGQHEFLFKNSFNEMLEEFNKAGYDQNIPFNWTIYYLRKKALTQKIEKEELAWILLNFNQKRGYYQLRGEEEEIAKNKLEEYYTLEVVDVKQEEKGKNGIWYSVVLENGWIYRRENKTPLDNWIGIKRDFIVSTDIDETGEPKLDKEGKVKRSFRSPKEEDWGLMKIKTEKSIELSGKSVGAYIFDNLLINPSLKIKGKFIKTIERKKYKDELIQILNEQVKHHPELKDNNLYKKCMDELYKNNEAHKNNIKNRDFNYLLIDDIIFYQRPLKSQKSQIGNCTLEHREYKDKNGNTVISPVKCVSKSHPLFQEFRLWQFVQNLKIYKRNAAEDIDETSLFFDNEPSIQKVFDFLNTKEKINQKQFLKFFNLKESEYRWNYVEDKDYPCNEPLALFLSKSAKIEGFSSSFFNAENTEALWHILYSVLDKIELESALARFAKKNLLPSEFINQFKKLKPFSSDYASLSAKAIKKLLPLMRMGTYWTEKDFDQNTVDRIKKILNAEYDETIKNRVREKSMHFNSINDFRGLPLWLASYIVYDRHSENSDTKVWTTPKDIDLYLTKEFKQHSLRNPIVEQVITESLRVVRDIWIHYGKSEPNFLSEIHVELGREMKNPADKRKQMTQKVTENQNTNTRIRKILEELYHDGIKDVKPYSPSQQEILKIYEEGVFGAEYRKEELEVIEKIRKNNAPSSSDIQRYKLWLEQGYISPYTGKVIKLSELFSIKYQIEHIFPQSRYFDDSLTNKVICESEVNQLKDNQTAYEFIKNHKGETVQLSNGQSVKILEIEDYEEHIKKYFSKNKAKLKNLLSLDIPESFVSRQMNDSRYISKVVRNYMSKIVREKVNGEYEMEANSKNVITMPGAITSQLKNDWGLNDVWNQIITPRFERLNEITKSQDFGYWDNKNGKKVFQIQVPEDCAKNFSKKRIDHRHHALDAIVIACTTREHINYLNSLNTNHQNYSLVKKLRRMEEVVIKDKKRNVPKEFLKPWDTFTQDVKLALETMIVSFKQNNRVLNKTTNKYEKYVDGKKVKVKQESNNHWAIRKPLHAETVSGKVLLKRISEKEVALNSVLDKIALIVDKKVRKQLINLSKEFDTVEKLKKHLKSNPIIIEDKKVDKVLVYQEIEATATRKSLDPTIDLKKIEEITDTAIQKILTNYLHVKGSPEIAFSPEGLEELNQNIALYNNGKPHKPIYKIRIWVKSINPMSVGETGNKYHKYVKAAKGTNLYFAVYADEEGKRSFRTIPLSEVIVSLKNKLPVAPEIDNGKKLLFTLSPNDIIYIPNNSTIEDPEEIKKNYSNFYKVVSFEENRLFVIPSKNANTIKDKVEYGSKNKIELTDTKISIKDRCWKIIVDRLGNIVQIQK